MTLTITSLRVDERKGEVVPYLIVNCCFTVEPEAHDGYLWAQAKGDSEEYTTRYPGYGRAWTHQDPVWQYIEKFDTFWLREWIADCPVTRAIVKDLEHYKTHGMLPTVYRTIDEGIILQHLRTLQRYWD